MQSISFKREVLNVLLRVGAVVTTIILLIVVVNFSYSSFGSISDGTCNIAVMPIEGVILPYSGIASLGADQLFVTPSDVRSFIKSVSKEYDIEGIMFEMNSPGGTPVAAEAIMNDIKSSTLPTVALIGDLGASGGYMAATGADTIVASEMSEVGGIGVTMSYVEESQKNKDEGLTFVSLSTGKFKDAGNPNKPLTAEERTLFERDLKIINDAFIKIVAENRLLNIEQVSALADGSTILGSRALDSGLIDLIGGRSEAKVVFAEKLNKNIKDIAFCEYAPKLRII